MQEKDLFGEPIKPNPGGGALARAFMVPPFSVLSARDGWWQERKRAWIALGIKSELGRGEVQGSRPRPAPSRKEKRRAAAHRKNAVFGPICASKSGWRREAVSSVFDPVILSLIHISEPTRPY